MKCVRGLELQALRSGAGWYIGTITEEDGYPEPMCRISVDYFRTRQDAENALADLRFPRREYAMECQFCRGDHLHCF